MDRIIIDRGTHTLVMNGDNEKHVPVFCGICEYVMNGDDVKSYEEHKCCSQCKEFWYFTFKNDWDRGWRPSKENVLTAQKDKTAAILDVRRYLTEWQT